jgi:putative SOS response-associated peptidase YedK
VCGRYTQTLKADDLAAAMSASDATGGAVLESYNVAPTARMPIVVGGAPQEERTLRLARWGLVPYWAKDIAIGSRLFNARSESLAEKPAFRAAFAKRRCLVPATGYYEWHKPAGSPARRRPYYIHPVAGRLLVFAGLYEVWRTGEVPLVSYTIVTTTSAGGLEFLHDRSPVMLPPPVWDRWLDPASTGAAELLVPAPAGMLAAHPVSPAVGNVRNQGPHLIDPVGHDGPPGPPGPPGPTSLRDGGAPPATPAEPTLFEW